MPESWASRQASKKSLTGKEIQYLKTVFKLLSGRDIVGSLEVADAMGVSCATASEYLGRLEEKGMVKRYRWRGVSLTEKGLGEVNRIIRNHRVFETYVYRFLSMGLQDACECASMVEQCLPEKIVDSMCSVLGHPKTCPHRNHIPGGRYCC
ncbi:MAG: metal-dependent transcriptional regulator [Candidatus Brockarchaeota archaeon]|nr:metal-dependent transcriptional regulator [Candidatus Brockarchaeota archaeon]MBO3808819.1 metal-dependent transcriptional regulator [Candidatus Brockarchaeota archaeon]